MEEGSVVAKRTNKALYVILGFVVSGLVLFILGFALKKTVWFFGAAIFFASLCFLIDYLLQPKTPITFDGKNIILLGNKVSAKTIYSVDYKPFRLGQTDFNWGTLNLNVNGKKYTFRYVGDCKSASEKLKELSK